jgi:hypothetical protein
MKLRLLSSAAWPSFEEARALSRNFEDARSLPEKLTSVELGAAVPLAELRTDFLFDYDVFPKTILRSAAEWHKGGRAMQVGDMIVQRAFFPPTGFGVCMEFAVRVAEIFRTETKLGFAYETLEGHAERGRSEFYFEERDGRMAFIIHTFSEPGIWWARLFGRVLMLPYQAWCTRRALRRVKRRFFRREW